MNVMVKTQPFSLPPLPYDEGALEPTISKRTMGFHYGKHHASYVKKLNELVAGTPLADLKLDDIVKSTYLDANKTKIFNNAAQAWNHSFFWQCLKAGGSKPSGELARRSVVSRAHRRRDDQDPTRHYFTFLYRVTLPFAIRMSLT